MPVEQANLHLEILKPQKGLQGARQIARVVEYLYGPDGLRLHQDFAHGREPSVDQVAVDNAFLHGLGKLNGLPDNASQRELARHYEDSLDKGYLVMEYVLRKVVPSYESGSGQHSELHLFSGRPTEALRLMATPTEGPDEQAIDPIYRFEAKRQLGLAILAGDFVATTVNGCLRERLNEIKKLFNQHLFAGREGANKPDTIYSYHDPSTGEVRGIGYKSEPPKPYLDVKQHNPRVRIVQGNGPVDYYPRQKETDSAVIKALVKSNLNGGRVATDSHVGDLLGAKFAVIKDARKGVEVVTREVRAALEHYSGDVVFEDDNEVDKHRGNSRRMKFVRFKAVFDGSFNFEVMIRSYIEELNARYAYGRFDTKRGYHTGEAHDLYKLRNVAQIVDLLLPPQFYGDHRDNIALQSQKTAVALRNSDNVISLGDPSARPRAVPRIKIGALVFAEVEGSGEIAQYKLEKYDNNGGVILNRNGAIFRTSAEALFGEAVIGQNRVIEIRDGDRIIVPTQVFKLEAVV